MTKLMDEAIYIIEDALEDLHTKVVECGAPTEYETVSNIARLRLQLSLTPLYRKNTVLVLDEEETKTLFGIMEYIHGDNMDRLDGAIEEDKEYAHSLLRELRLADSMRYSLNK